MHGGGDAGGVVGVLEDQRGSKLSCSNDEGGSVYEEFSVGMADPGSVVREDFCSRPVSSSLEVRY